MSPLTMEVVVNTEIWWPGEVHYHPKLAWGGLWNYSQAADNHP